MTLIFHRLPIKTARLIIRRFSREDLPGFLSFMLDAESTQYLAFTDEQKTKNDAEALFNTVLDSYQTEDPIESFALISKESGYYIGSVGFSPCGKDLYECYYAINKEGRRKGFACEAMQHLLALIDKRTVIKAYCSEKNVASIEVAKKLGMTPLGIETHPYSGLQGLVFEKKVNAHLHSHGESLGLT